MRKSLYKIFVFIKGKRKDGFMMKGKNKRISCDYLLDEPLKVSNNAQIPYNVLSKPKISEPKEMDGSGMAQKSKNGSNKKAKLELPKISKLEKEIKKCIIGQDEAVKKVITAIYRAIKFKSLKSNIIMIGNSGVGKTELIEQIAKRFQDNMKVYAEAVKSLENV